MVQALQDKVPTIASIQCLNSVTYIWFGMRGRNVYLWWCFFFLSQILKEKFGMVAPDVQIEDGKGTILISSEEGETEGVN